MKKIASLLFAVLLLCTLSVTAWADEEPNCLAISNLGVYITSEGQQLSLEFEGLELAFAPVENEDGQVFAVNILGDGNLLMNAAFKLDGNKVYFAVDGLSNTYSVEANTGAAVVSPSGESALSEEQIQAMVAQLMEEIEFSKKGNTTTFRIPYTTVTSMLEQILPAVEQSGNMDSESFEEFKNAVAEMKETNSGFELSGSLEQSDTDMSGVVNFLKVDNGVAADAPLAYADFSASADSAITGRGGIYVQEDGSYSQLASLTFSVGDTVDAEVEIESVIIHGSFDLSNNYLLLEVKMGEEIYALGASFQLVNRELTACPIGDLSAAIEVETMTEEQMTTMQTELTNAAANLIGFVMPALINSGIMG